MTTDSFHVTLSNKTSLDIYPKNRPGNFRYDMPASRKLEGDWEVGLIHINTWNQWKYETPDFIFEVWLGIPGDDLDDSIGKHRLRNLPDISQASVHTHKLICRRIRFVMGEWKSVEEFGKALASRIALSFKSYDVKLRASYYLNTTSNMGKFVVSGGMFLGFSTQQNDVMDILGIGMHRNTYRLTDKSVYLYQFGERAPVEGATGFPDVETMFVYCNVCESQEVGGSTGNLLKLVPLRNSAGVCQRIQYRRPRYVKVAVRHMETLAIRLCNSKGREFRFPDTRGFASIHMHFRKIVRTPML